MTEKKEQYIKNAGVVGSLPTQENWGNANGKSNLIPQPTTTEEVFAYLEAEAKRQGITVEELVAKRNDQ